MKNVTKRFPVRAGLLRRVHRHVQAVNQVSIHISPGETLGLVGESGSGKSTLGRLALRLIPPSEGSVWFDGDNITDARKNKALRRQTSMVFQDPHSSFDPLLPVGVSVGEPLDVHLNLTPRERAARLHQLAERVGLAPAHLERYPDELSGGQLQRLAIARALANDPRLVVLDEPVSSLDVSTQAQVINLLLDLQRDFDVAFLLIAHNPALVHHASDRIGVMYLGEIVEIGDADTIYRRPQHPYTQALLSAVTVPDPQRQRTRERIVLRGDLADATDPPSGCRFHTRCPYAMDVCVSVTPPAVSTSAGTTATCHLLSGEVSSVLTTLNCRPSGTTAQAAP